MAVPVEQITLKTLVTQSIPRLDVIAARMRPQMNYQTFHSKIQGWRSFTDEEFKELARVTGIAAHILEAAPTDQDVKHLRKEPA